jgi:hypothetical protein
MPSLPTCNPSRWRDEFLAGLPPLSLSYLSHHFSFYRRLSGTEPVRDWLKSLSVEDRRIVGTDIAAVEFGWPIGMPDSISLTAASRLAAMVSLNFSGVVLPVSRVQE